MTLETLIAEVEAKFPAPEWVWLVRSSPDHSERGAYFAHIFENVPGPLDGKLTFKQWADSPTQALSNALDAAVLGTMRATD
jgi:hypothetical protein